jgi:hypothetical protein
MKVIISLIVLVFATSVMASKILTEDVYNTNLSVKKSSIKCSLIKRKLRMKVLGLDQLGKFGKRYFKSVRKFDESCKTSKGRLLQILDNRRGPLDATVNSAKGIIKRTVWRNDRDGRGRAGRWGQVSGPHDFSYPVCEEFAVHKVRLQMAQITLGNLPLQLERVEEKYLGFKWGKCL